MRHPIQPVEKDARGVARFKANAIVQYLLDSGPFDMNHLAAVPFSREDREQFAQLIGYSLSGFGDLGYASDEVYDAACLMADREGRDSRVTVIDEATPFPGFDWLAKRLPGNAPHPHPSVGPEDVAPLLRMLRYASLNIRNAIRLLEERQKAGGRDG